MFYISQITVGNLKSVFDSCEEQMESRLNGEGERKREEEGRREGKDGKGGGGGEGKEEERILLFKTTDSF